MSDQHPDLDSFDHDAAWRVGSALTEQCRAAGHPVVITIWLGAQRVFHAALPGTSADNDRWAERKAGTVRHFALSSLEVAEKFAQVDPAMFFTMFALSPAEHAPAGGAVPITVRGSLVGVLAVSGLASEEDHALALDALRAEVAAA